MAPSSRSCSSAEWRSAGASVSVTARELRCRGKVAAGVAVMVSCGLAHGYSDTVTVVTARTPPISEGIPMTRIPPAHPRRAHRARPSRSAGRGTRRSSTPSRCSTRTPTPTCTTRCTCSGTGRSSGCTSTDRGTVGAIQRVPRRSRPRRLRLRRPRRAREVGPPARRARHRARRDQGRGLRLGPELP